MTHLYELSAQMRGLQEMMETGELDEQTLADTMEGLEGDIQVKGANTLEFMANLATEVTAYAIEIKRMQARKTTVEKNFNWFKAYLRDNMARSGITKIESATFTATLGKPGKVVEIVDSALIPESFVEVVPESYKFPKPPIAKALKAGQDVPGARLIDGQHRITIR
jgi:hypothetical protein